MLKKNIDINIFRGNDIRGIYPDQIDSEKAYTIGRAFGRKIKSMGYTRAVVGRDVRYSSTIIQANTIKGILDEGIDVVNIGLVTTPMYYYASIFLKTPSGIMITASHNPKEYNGFKFQYNGMNAKGEEVKEFGEYVNSLEEQEITTRGRLFSYDIKKDYVRLQKESLKIDKNKKIKVVIDLSNATTCVIAKQIFDCFPNIEVKWLFDNINPSFPNHHPDPSIEDNLYILKQHVLIENADLGISYDGDGDRLGIIDEQGSFVYIDRLMIPIIRDLVHSKKKKKFAFDVKCSKALYNEAIRLGCDVIMNRTGNSYLKSTLFTEDLVFAGEFSGHLFFKDRFPGFDSGIYNSLRIIELLMKYDMTMSELLQNVDDYIDSPEIKVRVTDKDKFNIIEDVKNYVIKKEYIYKDIDGVRVDYIDGFSLVRASNTGPDLTLRFEAKTKDRLIEIEKEYMDLINTLKEKYHISN